MSHGPTPPDAPRAPFDWETLARYLAGESPAAEEQAVRAWLDGHPGDAALLAALDRAVDATLVPAAAPGDVDVEAALRRVAARRESPDVVPLRPAAPRASPAAAARRPAWRAPALRAAAALVMVAGGVLWWRAARPTDDAVGATAAERVVATAVGARDSLRLPDGTRVVVGPGSRVVVPAGYGAAARDVRLEGEAYFEVVHDDARPFTVYAGRAAVRDVGTAFVVRTGPAGGAQVTVSEGSVELRPAGRGDAAAAILLREGDVGTVDSGGRVAARRGAGSADDVAWTRGRLVFRDAPLAEVHEALRRWHGVELRVVDSALAGRRLTASFDGEPTERVLDVVALALGARLERRGDTVFVRARPEGGGGTR